MAARNLIVVGGSAGGLEVVREVIAGLSPDLPAAVCVVVHVAPSGPGLLPHILNRVAPFPASHVKDSEPICERRIYVAAPNCHLVVRDGTVVSRDGPRENGFRPAIDPLFRSAAHWYGPRSLGVILSGAMDDGIAGLALIKARGGRVVVQAPSTAAVRGMPESAIRNVDVDEVVNAEAMADRLNAMVTTVPAGGDPSAQNGAPAMSTVEEEELGRATPTAEIRSFRCPDCHGPMQSAGNPSVLRFRCHEGHTYSAGSLLAKQSEDLTTSMRATVSALREQAALGRQVANHSRDRGDEAFANFVLEHVRRAENRLSSLVELLAEAEMDSGFEAG